MSMSLRQQLLEKLKDKEYRDAFVAEQVYSLLPLKIRALREDRGLTQKEIGERAGMAQAWVSKLEDPNYGKLTIPTLLKIASVVDVGLHVDFVPFSKVIDGAMNLDRESFSVPSYGDDRGLSPRQMGSISMVVDPVRGEICRGGVPVGNVAAQVTSSLPEFISILDAGASVRSIESFTVLGEEGRGSISSGVVLEQLKGLVPSPANWVQGTRLDEVA